jgi:hypothetical protein
MPEEITRQKRESCNPFPGRTASYCRRDDLRAIAFGVGLVGCMAGLWFYRAKAVARWAETQFDLKNNV